MLQIARIIVLMWLLMAAFAMEAQDPGAQPGSLLCNQDGTVCVPASVEKSVVQIPFHFQVRVRSQDQIILGWELRDDGGKILDRDPDGLLAFPDGQPSGSTRTLAVRDFGLAPAQTEHGELLLQATAFSMQGEKHPLPKLSIPVRIDLRTSKVVCGVPADPSQFSRAVVAAVESEPSDRKPIQASLRWRTETVLYVQPGMLGGAAAEAAARAYRGQSAWHVVDYREMQGTAHVAIFGSAWAGVTYYLAGLHYLVQRTLEHQSTVRRVVFDRPPDLGQ